MRKICFVITSFIHYARNLLILEELSRRADVELHVVVGGTALLTKYTPRYAQVRAMLEQDGIEHIHELYFALEGDNRVVKAKTAGLGIVEFATMFNDLKPDLVVVRGDRFEVLSAATAAAYMNIPLAHIEGGDITGTLDESVRHAITKLAHLHIATNEAARERLLRMGEDPRSVFNFGSPDVEVARTFARAESGASELSTTGSGALFDPGEDFVMVMYHPVWSEALEGGTLARRTEELLGVVHTLGIPTLWFWPNADVGSEEISHALRVFHDQTEGHRIRFMRYLPPRSFISLLARSRLLVGNSSAGIKECSYLGIPVVNIGSRQRGRMRAENVCDVTEESDAIRSAIEEQLAAGRYAPSELYHADGTAQNIAATLASAPLCTEKRFFE
ncbi:MAG: UDP-N-acetylglucosamine 2-epimerase [bacterium]|nr:UDP-N-acetylglucosamine 2-epimerase [bacterium]MDZ4285250.1 UDP-N-acetylglucosamine 2-epimerase [Patescibacteria group bacterium]